ncbi:fumarylacetoacetase [Neptunitalea lumnitzerae]|uniref:fumarylacetoacetase n=1 Tax=Neptunitalea lumnitzerae TaxID=2965509 RepID=A0ABQ5MIG8_9FLAO|nr:fumarylacetoacetase [Neptunitalea sp. Y10]GLB49216.1 fumarylacetoacetase [Neptunitalea sp. Y10]
MPNKVNDPNKTSWIPVAEGSDFPIQNIPFGVFLTRDDVITIGTRIGDTAIDLGALHQLGYFEGIPLTDDIFLQDTLNDFISDGQQTWRAVRSRISKIFDANTPGLRDNDAHKDVVLFTLDEIEMQMPVLIGDYTDFYSSKQHAKNIEELLNEGESDLLPNWVHIPIGYHGRSSSIVTSGIPVKRPHGQMFPAESHTPIFGTSQKVDFEMEVAFITTDANVLGDPVAVDEAEDYIFGMVLLNDWSARDIQKWEQEPLGAFLAKNFACSISPWIVTMDALAPFRTEGPKQEPKPFEYLQSEGAKNFDINLEASLITQEGSTTLLSKSNAKYMYWNMAQQLAHHTINGCKVNSGDMMASGALSGDTPDSYSSLLELTKCGKEPVTLEDGEPRYFVNDNDTISIKGYCQNDKVRIGFGEVANKLLPAITIK